MLQFRGRPTTCSTLYMTGSYRPTFCSVYLSQRDFRLVLYVVAVASEHGCGLSLITKTMSAGSLFGCWSPSADVTLVPAFQPGLTSTLTILSSSRVVVSDTSTCRVIFSFFVLPLYTSSSETCSKIISSLIRRRRTTKQHNCFNWVCSCCNL